MLLAGWAVTVYVVLSVCTLISVDAYGHAMLSFCRWELGWVAPQYGVQQLYVGRSNSEPAFNIAARNNDYVYVDGELDPPGRFTLQATIAVMPGLQYVVLVLLVPLAWPGLAWKRRLAALACAIPILCAVEFVDIPLHMVGGLDLAIAAHNHAPDTLAMTLAQILDTGGRLVLGLTGGLAACGIAAIFKNFHAMKAHA